MGTDLEKYPSYSERKKIKMQRTGHTVCVCVGGCMCVCGGVVCMCIHGKNF